MLRVLQGTLCCPKSPSELAAPHPVAALVYPFTNGSRHCQRPVDSPAVHERNKATQCFNTFFLILQDTA